MKKITMKKMFFILLVTSLSMGAVQLNAQEQRTASESRINSKIGVKGGLTLTNLYVDDVKSENMKVGGTFGLYAKVPLTTGVSFQPEILYAMKGSELEYNNVFARGKYRFNLNYVEIPLAFVFNVARNFNVHAGGYTAFLTSAKIKDVDQNGNTNSVTQLNKDNFRTTDYGILGGIGFDLGNTTLGGRYSYGLQEVGKSGNSSGNITQNSKNSAFSFYVGFGF